MGTYHGLYCLGCCLALLFAHGSTRMDEYFLDGIVCQLLSLLKRFGLEVGSG